MTTVLSLSAAYTFTSSEGLASSSDFNSNNAWGAHFGYSSAVDIYAVGLAA